MRFHGKRGPADVGGSERAAAPQVNVRSSAEFSDIGIRSGFLFQCDELSPFRVTFPAADFSRGEDTENTSPFSVTVTENVSGSTVYTVRDGRLPERGSRRYSPFLRRRKRRARVRTRSVRIQSRSGFFLSWFSPCEYCTACVPESGKHTGRPFCGRCAGN